MAVFDTMRHVGPDVSTVCVGLAASMGAFLLASGHKAGLLLPKSVLFACNPNTLGTDVTITGKRIQVFAAFLPAVGPSLL